MNHRSAQALALHSFERWDCREESTFEIEEDIKKDLPFIVPQDALEILRRSSARYEDTGRDE